MNPLDTVRQRLAHLRWRRRQARWGIALATILLAVLGALAVLFALDVAFGLNVAQRAAMLVLGLGLVIWACRRFAAPYLGVRETETDVAILVEREQRIDSDLVAAIQFERAEAARWGSSVLESAVVHAGTRLTPQIESVAAHRSPILARRAKLLAVTLAAAVVTTAAFPRHVAIFFSRLMLSNRHYPSRTTLESVLINRVLVMEWNPRSMRPRDVKAPQSRPVTFLVRATGQLPEQGSVECESLLTRVTRALPLTRISAADAARLVPGIFVAGDPALQSWFTAEMPQLVEGFRYQIRLGDAWTDPATVTMMALPVVEVSIKVRPPDYVGRTEEPPSGGWHIAVLEGSRVDLSLRSVNDTPLRDAKISFTVAGDKSEYPLAAVGEDRLQWRLLADHTPLAAIKQEVGYEVQVTNKEGLTLESPLRGFIQLKPDRPPSAVANVIHRLVLPSAKPIVDFRLSDDFGVSSALVQLQIERRGVDNSTEAASGPVPTSITIPLDPHPLRRDNLPYRGQFPLELTPMKLAKGDLLKVTLQVTDYRGEAAGKEYVSEPLLLEVSDESGVLAEITSADELSEKRLNDVIKQQLGVGEKR